jgi:hypothetical protein
MLVIERRLTEDENGEADEREPTKWITRVAQSSPGLPL